MGDTPKPSAGRNPCTLFASILVFDHPAPLHLACHSRAACPRENGERESGASAHRTGALVKRSPPGLSPLRFLQPPGPHSWGEIRGIGGHPQTLGKSLSCTSLTSFPRRRESRCGAGSAERNPLAFPQVSLQLLGPNFGFGIWILDVERHPQTPGRKHPAPLFGQAPSNLLSLGGRGYG